MIAISTAAKELLVAFAHEAPEHDGYPPVALWDDNDSGLDELVEADLIEIFVEGGYFWDTVGFTDAGVEYAGRLGVDLSGIVS